MNIKKKTFVIIVFLYNLLETLNKLFVEVNDLCRFEKKNMFRLLEMILQFQQNEVFFFYVNNIFGTQFFVLSLKMLCECLLYERKGWTRGLTIPGCRREETRRLAINCQAVWLCTNIGHVFRLFQWYQFFKASCIQILVEQTFTAVLTPIMRLVC